MSCVVDGRQRVRHTLEANKRLLKEGKEPLLVPAVAKRGSAIRMAQAMVSANEIRRQIRHWAEQRKWLMRWNAGTTRTI